MRDRGGIYTGLLIFLGLITFPVWHDLAAGTTSRGPEPVLPTQEKQCVAPREFMRTSHMHLLTDWRDAVVRHNVHSFKAFNGKTYSMRLAGTCLSSGCHTNKADFCDRCHNYAAVSVTCWDCHVDPKLTRPASAGASPAVAEATRFPTLEAESEPEGRAPASETPALQGAK